MGRFSTPTQLPKKWNHYLKLGEDYRKKRKGRGRRPLSMKDPHHVVFKIDKDKLKQLGFRSPQTFKVINPIIKKYSKKFFIKIEHKSIQNDHIHLLIRTTKRSLYQYFFRVIAGQIAQQLEKEGLLLKPIQEKVTDTPQTAAKKLKLWIQRPFSRVVKGYKAYKTVMDYIQLNEKEATGEIKNSKLRLRGLSLADWQILWS